MSSARTTSQTFGLEGAKSLFLSKTASSERRTLLSVEFSSSVSRNLIVLTYRSSGPFIFCNQHSSDRRLSSYEGIEESLWHSKKGTRNTVWNGPTKGYNRRTSKMNQALSSYKRRSVDTASHSKNVDQYRIGKANYGDGSSKGLMEMSHGAKNRVDTLSENQNFRLHNQFTVFERVIEPDFCSADFASESSLTRKGSPGSQSRKNVTPSALEEAPLSTFHPPSQECSESASKFTSKLQEILNNFKKKGQHNRTAEPVWSENFKRDLSQKENATSSSVPAQRQVISSSNFQMTSEGVSGTFMDVSLDGLPTSSKLQHGIDYTNTQEKVKMEGTQEDEGSPFNSFSKPPSIPSDANTSFVIPKSPIRSNFHPRHLSKSVGSRSIPSRPSIPGKRSKYSKPDPNAGHVKHDIRRPKPLSILATSKLVGDYKLNGRGDKTGLDENDDETGAKYLSHRYSPACDPKSSQPAFFEWSDSESELEDGTEIASSTGSLAKSSQPAFFEWSDSESELEDGTEIASSSESLASPLDDAIKVGANVEAGITPSKECNGSSRRNFKHEFSTPFANQHICDLPFEIQYSYSEIPNAPVLGYREPQFSPFGPVTMSRPWTGCAPFKQSNKKLPEFDSFDPPPKKRGVKYVQAPGPFLPGEGPKQVKSREEILGEPLTDEEIRILVQKCHNESRQLNLGRDGLTHNMLDLVHCHWKRRRVCRIKCKGVPTVDMDNVCFHLEDKTGGKVIYRTGGTVYLFRGRNYNYKDRPRIPLMLWKPHSPMYPKLIQAIPEGLTKDQAYILRQLGRKVEPLCKLNKNGVYLNLVKDVKNAFKVDDLVRIDCEGLHPSDYKKIGAKLKDLVPCVLLSFQKEQILMWKGRDKDSTAVPVDNITHPGPEEEGKGLENDSMLGVYMEPKSEEENRDEDEGSFVGMEMASFDEIQFSEALMEEDDSMEMADMPLIERRDYSNLQDKHDTMVGPVMEKEEEMEFGASVDEEQHGSETLGQAKEEELLMETLANDNGSNNGGCRVVVVKVDDLWEQALQSGMALLLNDEDLTPNLAFQKVAEFSQNAPPGPVYSHNLIRKLSPKEEEEKSKELFIHFGKLGQKKTKLKRKMLLPTVDAPPMGALPVDHLARLLITK